MMYVHIVGKFDLAGFYTEASVRDSERGKLSASIFFFVLGLSSAAFRLWAMIVDHRLRLGEDMTHNTCKCSSSRHGLC